MNRRPNEEKLRVSGNVCGPIDGPRRTGVDPAVSAGSLRSPMKLNLFSPFPTVIVLLLLSLVSGWGEDNSVSPSLLYLYGDVSAEGEIPSGEAEPFHQMRLNDEGRRGMSQFRSALEAAGFTMEEAYDAETALTTALLESHAVLILGSNQHRFSAAERAAVVAFVYSGGGLVAWSDSAFGGHYSEVGLGNELGRLSDNDIMTAFGMYFMTDNGAGNYLVRQYEFDHYLNNFRRDGGIAFRGEGVSSVRVSPPARMLARLQEGGLGGGIRLNPVDGEYDPDRDAALAIAEVGKGRVVGIFDRNLFWNAGEGTRLSHSDNREFAQRVMIWAAGAESELEPDKPRRTAAIRNEPPEVEVSFTLAEDQHSVILRAEVRDEDEDNVFPEVVWQQGWGSEPIRFENNNPNAPEVRVFLDQPGDYHIRAIVKDGEYQVSRSLRFTIPE